MWKRTNKVAIYLLTILFVIFFSNHVILLLHKSSEQERYNSITQVRHRYPHPVFDELGIELSYFPSRL